jgi:hypothetical protein
MIFPEAGARREVARLASVYEALEVPERSSDVFEAVTAGTASARTCSWAVALQKGRPSVGQVHTSRETMWRR